MIIWILGNPSQQLIYIKDELSVYRRYEDYEKSCILSEPCTAMSCYCPPPPLLTSLQLTNTRTAPSQPPTYLSAMQVVRTKSCYPSAQADTRQSQRLLHLHSRRKPRQLPGMWPQHSPSRRVSPISGLLAHATLRGHMVMRILEFCV